MPLDQLPGHVSRRIYVAEDFKDRAREDAKLSPPPYEPRQHLATKESKPSGILRCPAPTHCPALFQSMTTWKEWEDHMRKFHDKSSGSGEEADVTFIEKEEAREVHDQDFAHVPEPTGLFQGGSRNTQGALNQMKHTTMVGSCDRQTHVSRPRSDRVGPGMQPCEFPS